jgi:hypothetical protein
VDDQFAFDLGPPPDAKEAAREARLRWETGRGLEIVRDPLGRVA